MDLLQQISTLIDERSELIDAIIERLEARVLTSQGALRKAIDVFLELLDVDESGAVKSTLANKRRLNQLDRIFDTWATDDGANIIREFVAGVERMQEFNQSYFLLFTTKAELGPILASTREQLQDWLGITSRGNMAENGYLSQLLSDTSIKNQVRNNVFSAIVSQKGFFETRKQMAEYIEGQPGKTGALQRYYAGLVYDTFNTVDRTQTKIIADKLKLEYFLYEGGIVRDSRQFCIDHNGKVYTTEEVEKFHPKEANSLPNYDPFTGLGGPNCRHHLNPVPAAVAFALRPELKRQVEA